MKKAASVVLALAVFVAVQGNLAQAKGPNEEVVNKLLSKAKSAFGLCSLAALAEAQKERADRAAARLAESLGSTPESSAPTRESETVRCISSEKETLAELYKAFTAKFTKNTQALGTARLFYANALGALDGIPALPGERAFSYDNRQNSNLQKMIDLENLLRVDTQ